MATISVASERLTGLPPRWGSREDFAQLTEALRRGDAATLDGAWGSACAPAAAAFAGASPATFVVVYPKIDDVDVFVDDLAVFSSLDPERLPAREVLPHEKVVHDDLFGERIRVLKRLTSGDLPEVLVTCVQSLLQPVPSHETLSAKTRIFRAGQTEEMDDLVGWLTKAGFHNTTAVELPGEFSVRGGIVDIYAPDWEHPVRIEFFGDEIDSIRTFDAATQRSLATLDSVEITLLDPNELDTGFFTDYLPDDTWYFLVEPIDLEEQARHYLERLDRPEEMHSYRSVMERILKCPSVTASSLAASSFETTCRLGIESVERFSGDLSQVRDHLQGMSENQDVIIVCSTAAEIERLTNVFEDTQLAKQERLHFTTGKLSAGFRVVEDRLTILSSDKLFQRTEIRRTARRRLGKVIDTFLDLRPGDLVVHLTHGIGRYRGMELLEKAGQVEEHLALEYRGGTKLYVPASKIGLVQKYVGGSKSRPTLAKLGGTTWQRRKASVQKAVNDLAAELIDLQAMRASRPGIRFEEETPWQLEFGASFPYTETEDQMRAITSVHQDMEVPRPMDRLLCGDVGYGKTEVAMRAAFKAVDSGYQVAMLVPTTVLAEQHFRTFTQRMSEFPFEIAVLSRFSTKAEQGKTIKRLAAGGIDVVIGTHRLVSQDVKFHNLGLVIIDEEQRFGVAVKERLKTLRSMIDVLTTTATPIPRTLHMSLMGIRDISNLETAPEDRLPVETRVTRFDHDVIRNAIIRELNRDGQIFFVHNRVGDIEVVAKKLSQIVPEARIEIGHAQMPEGRLEKVMLDFVDHKFDILLSTTIIESGLDIPNANTIFIDEADRYGLADLHQLRGRVGRYKHRAYCYLLVDPNKALTPTAVKRLNAIQEYSEMGAGFAIAMRDLEIRGAGNLLGTQQSGHIDLVGYELYCQLLEQAARRLKKLPPKLAIEVDIDLPCEAFIPRSFIPDQRAKIDIYRRLSRATNETELQDLEAEIHDRFGEPPEPFSRLFRLGFIRLAAHRHGINQIHLEDGFVVFGFFNRAAIEKLSRNHGNILRFADQRTAYLPTGNEVADIGAVLTRIEQILEARL